MLPARRPHTENALDAALDRLAGGPIDRPDTPDLHVTAMRRLPAVAAQFAPFPEGLDERRLAESNSSTRTRLKRSITRWPAGTSS